MGLFLVEKFLCIINQTGLVELRQRDTDKRVVRLAAASGGETPSRNGMSVTSGPVFMALVPRALGPSTVSINCTMFENI